MVELLQYSRHEEQHRRPEWMAVQKDTDVYLETVETAKDAKTEADRTGNARMGSKWRSLQSKVLLENGRERCTKQSPNKRKTDKLGGFYDLATAYQSMHVNYWNRRVPSGMHGGVRGRRLVTASYSIRKMSIYYV